MSAENKRKFTIDQLYERLEVVAAHAAEHPVVFPHHRHLSAPKGRTFIAGDIHGHPNTLLSVLSERGFNPEHDICVLVGDLVDRGRGCLEALSLLNNDHFYSVAGNHEIMWARALVGNEACFRAILDTEWKYLDLIHESPASEMIMESSFVKAIMRDDWRDIYKQIAESFGKMPYQITLETRHGLYGVTHAESPPLWDAGRYMSDTAWQADLVWERRRFAPRPSEDPIRYSVAGVDGVITGHTIIQNAGRVGNVICIDTGAFIPKEGKLTVIEAAELPDLLQQPPLTIR